MSSPRQEKRYVLVACGEAVHTRTLQYALRQLQALSACELWVVTDQRRNEEMIEHPLLIDVATPAHLSHHQAAIFLKTSLHRYLDMQHLYCYLDTDVLAVRAGIDDIFDYFCPPVSFCTDHCRMPAFSPSCIFNPGTESLLKKQQTLELLRLQLADTELEQERKAGIHLHHIRQIREAFNQRRPGHAGSLSRQQSRKTNARLLANKVVFQVLRLLSFLLPLPADACQRLFEKVHHAVFGTPFSFEMYARQHGYDYQPTTGKWYDRQGNCLYEENSLVKAIERNSEFRWDAQGACWRDAEANNISSLTSDLLRQLIYQKFDVLVEQADWQHWNGGVFLFDRTAVPFLEQWHRWTLDIFTDPHWKTRDQGTLIACCWRFGLQQHPTLPVEYNFLADYYNPALVYKGDLCFEYRHKHNRLYRPFFLHIYHHFGDRQWPVWQDLEEIISK